MKKESKPLLKRRIQRNFADNNDSSYYLSEPNFNPTIAEASNSSNEINKTYQLKNMESAFGEDFSDVSIIENSSEASSLGAHAFTQNSEIHFASGKYQPETQQGQELLGHELTHVLQQRSQDIQPTTSKNGKDINTSFNLELEAEQSGKAVSHGLKPSFKSVGPQIAKVNQPIQAYGLSNVTDFLGEKGSQAWDMGKSSAGWAQDKVGSVVEKTSGFAGSLFGNVKEKAVDTAEGAMDVIPAIKDFVSVSCHAIEDILGNPVGFLKNLLEAVKNGFGNFFDNLTQHILSGLTQWLIDSANQAGIKFPAKFDLAGIISIVQQIINSIWSYVKQRIIGNLSKIISDVGDRASIVIEKVIDLAPTSILEALKKIATSA